MAEEDRSKIPRSMVFKMGDNKRQVSNTLTSLVRDFRQIMQPHTAARLKERKGNKLKDFVVMAGPLGVSHLFIFSQSLNHNTTLRVARTPRGPTLSFQVTSYSLCKDIAASQKTPKSLTPEFLVSPPLLVMNGFKAGKESSKEALLTSMFQNMFPALDVSETRLSGIKRVLILNKIPQTDDIEIRHYAIETKSIDVSKQIKKLANVKRKLNKELPNLSKKENIADFLLDDYNGFTSDSEVEDDATVQIAERKQLQVKLKNQDIEEEASTSVPTKKAIKLVEVGPRLHLSLRKIEDGMCDGKTLFHSYIHKSEKEEKALEKAHEEKARLKAQRRKVQEENVRRKKEAESNKMSRTKRGLFKQKEKDGQATQDDGNDGSENEKPSDDDLFDGEDVEQNLSDMDDYDLELANMSDEVEDDSEDEE